MYATNSLPSPPLDDPAVGVGTPLWQSLGLEKQEQVVRAAVEEFADSGYGGASMNSLVKRAGISKGSLFTYFRSKSGLFDAIVRMAVGRIRQDLRQLRDESRTQPFAQRLDALLRTGFAFLDSRPHLASIYFRLLQGGDAPSGTQYAVSLRRRSQDFLEDLIREGQDKGELRRDLPAGRQAFLLNLQMEAILCAWQGLQARGEGGGTVEERASLRETWIGDLMRLVLDGMATERTKPSEAGSESRGEGQ